MSRDKSGRDRRMKDFGIKAIEVSSSDFHHRFRSLHLSFEIQVQAAS